MIGAWRRVRGHSHLIKAIPLVVKKHPETVFVFVGSKGETFNECQELIKELKIEKNVEVKGFFPYYKLRDLIVGCDFGLFLSKTTNTPSIAMLEMAGCMKTFVVADTGKEWNVVENNRTCLTVEFGNVEQYANAINKLIEDREFRRFLELGAFFAAQNHTVERNADAWNELFKKVIENHKFEKQSFFDKLVCQVLDFVCWSGD